MNLNKLKGTGVALVTPFHKDGSIDFKSFRKIIDRCIDGKVEYLVPLGTTGESATLTNNERRAVVDFVIEINDKRLPIVLGLGGNNTQEILDTIEEFDFEGIDAILSVSPYYNRPSQRGIIQHYKMIGNACPVPVILYNVPSRTGSNLDADTTLQLAHEVKNIVGIKEASGNLEKAMKILKNRPKDFLVISGDDVISLPMIACGADGVISVVANAFPKDFSEMIRLSLDGNFEKSRKLHYKLLEIMHAIFIDGNPSGVKGLMTAMNICSEHVRLPLTSVNRSAINRFEAFL
ncbi:MAG TPA: 4-hydroxy-tetrahydrodipicolinate synthase [Bacteroidia bacterium]|nr:4-hydroxy-tetrahydrodipicolinate synthase [Bacteroidota bacterium]MBP9790658.1 4-hydroxy-tetrahydrodipicolinate synthase [Bacteroidia bacterium]MBK7572282.1 4-hydroxy-tetrahydrodipicolinate synthase [Bacteroidota bacterium]MBK8586315.1 4-hydroxy-tetrahydrodipicolinate synthase [Bacteroidota bacterium]MBP9922942.1 4-hydroxy-tetrahydrodipicolinate synthase [Bacteroidia bacterium]